MSRAFMLAGSIGHTAAIISALFLFDREHGPLNIDRIDAILAGIDDSLRVEIIHMGIAVPGHPQVSKVLIFDLINEKVYQHLTNEYTLTPVDKTDRAIAQYVSPMWPTK